MASGIYAIENLVNGKRYVGSAIDIKQRWSEHRRTLRKGSHHSRHLQRAWNKYGEQYFGFVVLEYVMSEFLLDIEQRYLDSRNHAYNMTKCAGAPQRGKRLSVTHREKISKALLGIKRSQETKAKMSLGQIGNSKGRGHVITPDNRQKLNAAKKATPLSIETRQKMSAAKKGKPLSLDIRAKMSEGQRKYRARKLQEAKG